MFQNAGGLTTDTPNTVLQYRNAVLNSCYVDSITQVLLHTPSFIEDLTTKTYDLLSYIVDIQYLHDKLDKNIIDSWKEMFSQKYNGKIDMYAIHTIFLLLDFYSKYCKYDDHRSSHLSIPDLTPYRRFLADTNYPEFILNVQDSAFSYLTILLLKFYQQGIRTNLNFKMETLTSNKITSSYEPIPDAMFPSIPLRDGKICYFENNTKVTVEERVVYSIGENYNQMIMTFEDIIFNSKFIINENTIDFKFIIDLPKNLCFHIAEETYMIDIAHQTKNIKKYGDDFMPPDNLDIAPLLKWSVKEKLDSTETLYELYAFTVYDGGDGTCGHYYSYIKNPDGTYIRSDTGEILPLYAITTHMGRTVNRTILFAYYTNISKYDEKRR